jgi:hypothetical protein
MRASIDEVAYGFSLQDVEFPVQHRASGKLSGKGLSRTRRNQRCNY